MSHFTSKFLKGFKEVERLHGAGQINESQIAFRDLCLKLGHVERVRNLYRIQDKLSKRATFFQLNKEQDKYLKNRTGSDIILKCRQVGFTTLSCVRALDLALWEPNTKTGIMAHEQNKVQTIFTDNTKFTYRAFKKDWGHLYSPVEKSDSATSLEFINDGLGRVLESSMRVLYDFRGKTIHFLHVSEAARVEADRLLGSLNGVPDNGEIIFESTAAGMGGEFYRQWQNWRSMGTLAPFKGHFVPWFEVYPEEPDKWELPPDTELTSYEVSLLKEFGDHITEAHLAWRRATIEKKCQGDVEKFEEEYPTNDIDCFLSGSSSVFPSSIIKSQSRNTRPPTFIGFLLSEGGDKVKLHEDAKGTVLIWEKPEWGSQYVIGADPSGGIGKDAGVAYVLNRNNRKLVACLYGQIDPGDFAVELIKLGTWYNKAFINPESNNHGGTVLHVLKTKNYRNIYRRREIDEVTSKPTTKLGFLTTNESKLRITENLKNAFKNGKLIALDNSLIQELTTFIQVASKTGRSIKREASSGSHDDRVMAAALTIEMDSVRGEINLDDETNNLTHSVKSDIDDETGFPL